ncbi:hypothetical protein GCM10022415_31830 [Knoellia locipacati]|uniref:HPr kinase n=1 Tax=Knoellia locipacati TaxID=882824 RepID=A0A512T3S3_9MICO|nr:hypothetical protein KLO01_28600 [Knoellia locipacati]
MLDAPVRVGPFAAGSVRFVIEADEPAVAAELDAVLTDLRTDPRTGPSADGGDANVTFTVARRDPPSTTHPWQLWRDLEPCERVTEDYLVPYVLWEVTRLLLERTEGVTPVHAAAVARDGRAIVLAGESHAGKSTLAGWLTAHGWEFLTDEVALVTRSDERSWEVRPFPRPVGVRHPSPLDPFLAAHRSALPGGRPGAPLEARSESLVPASTLGSLSRGAPLTAIVLPTHRPGSDGTLSDAHPASAVRALAAHLPLRREHGRAGFREVVDLGLSVPAFTLEVDDLAQADTTLTSLLTELGS